MQKNLVLCGLITLAVLGGAPLAQAKPGPLVRAAAWKAHVANQLGLTAAQQQKIAALKSTLTAKLAPIQASIKVLRAKEKELWLATTPDRAALLQNHQAIYAEQGKFVEPILDFRLGVFNVLTPEQRTKLRGGVGQAEVGLPAGDPVAGGTGEPAAADDGASQ